MNSSDIAHLWANRKGSHRTLRSCSFNGTKFYSYSTVIGQIIKDKRGNDCFLINDNWYSSSTSKHQSAVRGAIPYGATIFYVPRVSAKWRGSFWGAYSGITENKGGFDYYRHELLEQLIEYAKSLSNCSYAEYLENKNEFNKFSENFKLSFEKLEGSYTSFINGQKDSSFKKAARLIWKGAEFEEFADNISGKGTFEKFIESHKVSFNIAKKNHYAEIAHIPSNFITVGEIRKHQDDLIHFLFEKKKEYAKVQFLENEARQNKIRYNDAKKKLEKYCGMTGFTHSWVGQKVFSHDYNGKKVTLFTNEYWIEEIQIQDEEYQEFTKMSDEERRTFIHDKNEMAYTYLTGEIYKADHADAIRAAERKKADEIRREIEIRGEEYDATLWKEGQTDRLFNTHGVSFYHGGNVLLRYNPDKKLVETTKGIELSVEECKRLWPIVKRWHENNSTFSPGETANSSKLGKWRIKEFSSDILIAGCHAISFFEMEECAKKLGITA